MSGSTTQDMSSPSSETPHRPLDDRTAGRAGLIHVELSSIPLDTTMATHCVMTKKVDNNDS